MSAAVACLDCPAPITQPAIGRRKVFCAACLTRRKKQQDAARHAALSPEMREAQNQANREWRDARTPEQVEAENQAHRERRLQREYGIGIDERDALLAAQGGRCKICATAAPGGYGWHVDHNHNTGAVRGILCHGCNIGIGHLRDDPAILRGAIAYLESHATEVTS